MRGDFKVTNVSAFVLVAMMSVLGVVLFAAVPELRRGARQGESDSLSKVLGDWEGESVCVDKNRPACHDEQVVYHVVKKEGAPDTVTVAADKIVGGQPEQMYVLDFKYDDAKGTLKGEFNRNGTRGVFEYAVKGDEMDGTLKTPPAGTLVRRIKVKRAPFQTPKKPPRG